MAEEREQWGRQLEFILTMIGYAVGLGNVWRFPYLCFQNGGGAFLIPYVICLVLLGIPMFALECAFGQYGGKGPLSIWSINPTFKGLGISMVVAAALIFIYYDVIIAWGLRFLVASFTTDLPWVECHDCSCLLYNQKNVTSELVETLRYNNSLNIPCPNISINGSTSSPSELFFSKEILNDSGSIEEAGEIQWQLLIANGVAYAIVFLVLLKGIQSLGKVVYFTATFPYVLLTILLVRSAMLDGAYEGVIYYLTPRWERLADASMPNALGDVGDNCNYKHMFIIVIFIVPFSYCFLIIYYLPRDAFMIPIINCLTSFYAGFVVFCTLGHMAKIKNVDIDDVTKGGPGLAFIVYPEAIASMPVSTLWAILFFFMLCILGFSTQCYVLTNTLRVISVEDHF
ncbi:sodium- and chloride-dependent glycine transporter 1 [Aplysia californica]|uniref:Transporter n=1 Tax=Aplysia californica TaxID=6500 RepID=A0ABM1VUI1_APLCA|nr:sodium- and chloride-dependent glycine transporter 1 [Aplysia californica]